MFSEGAAKLWFFLFIVCLFGGLIAGYGYTTASADADQLVKSYRLLHETATSAASNYNNLNTQYQSLSETYTKLLVDYTKVSADYKKMVDDYNKLAAEYDKLANK